jgi:uroporphyrinogen-III synthase
MSTVDNSDRLKGKWVLVTRPEHQAEALCGLIERQGGIAVRFPTLVIQAILPDVQMQEQIANLHSFDWVIFVSANAVNFAVKAINGKIDQLQKVKTAAVGNATAKAMHDNDIAVDLVPEQGFNSEALLAAEPFQSVAKQRILIVRGRGGREKLAENLRERGATVEYMEVYKRTMPVDNPGEIIRLLQQQQIDALTITSGEALHNLLKMLASHAQLLLQLPLVVISERIKQMAQDLGFHDIAVTVSPADQAILETLITLQRGK